MDLVTLALAKSYTNKKIGEGTPGANVTGATVGQIVEIAAVDKTGKPTAWKAVDKPAKLSDLKNDLFYANATEALTITKADFIPKYVPDEDGNPTDEIEGFYYKGTPALDWFTSPDKIGFVVQFTEGDEPGVINHHVPNVTAQLDDSQWTYSGYLDEDGPSAPFIVCDECGLAIANGANVLDNDGPVPENAFYIQVFGWWDAAGVGFDSITIYQVDSKKIPKELYDHSEIDLKILDLGEEVNFLSDQAWQANQNANNAQTAAENAQTTANNAQTAADNAQITATKNASEMLVLKTVQTTLPNRGKWYDMAYGAGKFVVLNCDGTYTSRLPAISEDGINWRESNAISLTDGGAIEYTKIIYTGEIFIVAGKHQSAIYISTDGVTWNARIKLKSTFNCGALAYGDGLVVMISSATNEGYCFTNPDQHGTTNTAYFHTYAGSQTDKDVAYGNGKFVLCAGGIEYAAYNGSDTLSWTSANAPFGTYTAVTYGADKFVAVGKVGVYGEAGDSIVYSTDGAKWSRATGMPDLNYRAVAYGADKFVAVATNSIVYSTDGVTWSIAADVPELDYRAVTYGAGKFVAVAGDITACSTDGITWSTEHTGIYQNDVDVTGRIRKLLGSSQSATT